MAKKKKKQPQYCKVISLQLKFLKKEMKKKIDLSQKLLILTRYSTPQSWKPKKKSLQLLIGKLLKHSLLVPSVSNTPILPIVELNEEYRMIQDLGALNDAVVPIHPLVANPYISSGSQRCQMVYCS